VSVVVPNYNYARYLPKRLSSIFMQTHPVREVVVLDDCSTDNSVEVIRMVASQWRRNITIVQNDLNSGSVFKQWRRAAEQSLGEYLWIAEADDYCKPPFLMTVLRLMRHDSSVQFAFSDSAAVDADDNPMWPTYQGYYQTIRRNALSRTEVFEARDFVEQFLSVKNVILNASAVVWRREALLNALNASETHLATFRMAGDWRVYLQALSIAGARVAYCSEPNNVHRRHAASVTHALDADRHLAEIAACHSFATSEFGLGPGIREKQSCYLLEVTSQLAGTTFSTTAGEQLN
jgi:glycosyltransferase involved in cell wall biosynthesis